MNLNGMMLSSFHKNTIYQIRCQVFSDGALECEKAGLLILGGYKG
jgi:hypothetical protein